MTSQVSGRGQPDFGGDATVDPKWYLERYPDVEMSGMDPVEHFHWLGRRLGRLPAPASAASAANIRGEATGESIARDANPYSNEAIAASLKRLFDWLFPTGSRVAAFAATQFESVASNFWNDESNGGVTINPNGALVVDFMRDFRPVSRGSIAPPRQRRRPPQSILLGTYYAPSRAHAGGLRILDVYEQIRERHPDVHLTLFCPSHPKVDGDVSFLGELFNEIYFCEPHQFTPERIRDLAPRRKSYDLVDLQFHQAGLLADGFRQLGRRLIYTPMEVLSRFDFDLVRQRTAEGQFPLEKLFSLVHRGAEEHRIMQSVDTTVCVSDADAEFLLTFAGRARVTNFPTGLSNTEFADQLRPGYRPVPFSKRKDRLVFAAYFGSETNSAGLEWYLREVHPRVVAACPNYNLAVVGRGDTKQLEALGAPAASFIGEVPRLSPVLEQCKGGLVLALHGSGFRGKINQYALCGLPSVTTSLGATGLSYVDGEDILVADGAKNFADKCVAILTKDRLAQRLSKGARKRALENYTWAAIWPKVASIYGLSVSR